MGNFLMIIGIAIIGYSFFIPIAANPQELVKRQKQGIITLFAGSALLFLGLYLKK